jgi:hypothetical protein
MGAYVGGNMAMGMTAGIPRDENYETEMPQRG